MTATAADPSTRTRILAAATEVFREHGYAGTRVQDVARRAGLTTGAIYSNFGGKADLLLEVVATTGADELHDVVAQVPHGARAIDVLARLARNLPRKRADRPLALEAFAAASRDPGVASRVRGRLEGGLGMLRSLVAAAQRDGDIDAVVDARAVEALCLALSLGFVAIDALDLAQPSTAAWTRLVDRVIGSLEEDSDVRRRRPASR